MEKFKVHVDDGDGSTVYAIVRLEHDGTNVAAGIEALQTFARHGHARFPYNRRKLIITVEVDPDA